MKLCFQNFRGINICVFLIFSIHTSTLSQENRIKTSPQFCNEDAKVIWDSITNFYYGVAGTGFIGEDELIGECSSKYNWGGPWKPIDGFKHTLCGYLSIKKRKGIFKRNDQNKNYHLVSDGDGDLVFYIIPDPAFRWLQFKSLRPQGHEFLSFSIAAEVAIKEPGNKIDNDAANYFESLNADSMIYKPIGVYGPWVSDVHHDNSPEIHPIQQMWRVEQKQNGITEYQLFSFLDNSSRFTDKKDYADTCFMKPWITIPLKNVFYIPIEIRLEDSSNVKYNIEMPSSYNINYYESEKKETLQQPE